MKQNTSPLSLTDQLIVNVDQALRVLFAPTATTERPYPAQDIPEVTLSTTERQHVAGLMRINHAGEISAQALYQGQALTARDNRVRDAMAQAAREEADHLAWCRQRLQELDSQPSYFDVLWFTGALMIGMAAGFASDKISLGFVVATEQQVAEHLRQHLASLPVADQKSQAILEQMRQDEMQHAHAAEKAGAVILPPPIQFLMHHTANIMKTVAYYI